MKLKKRLVNNIDSCNRICLWSGPRNVSTAMMYSFSQRKDSPTTDARGIKIQAEGFRASSNPVISAFIVTLQSTSQLVSTLALVQWYCASASKEKQKKAGLLFLRAVRKRCKVFVRL